MGRKRFKYAGFKKRVAEYHIREETEDAMMIEDELGHQIRHYHLTAQFLQVHAPALLHCHLRRPRWHSAVALWLLYPSRSAHP